MSFFKKDVEPRLPEKKSPSYDYDNQYYNNSQQNSYDDRYYNNQKKKKKWKIEIGSHESETDTPKASSQNDIQSENYDSIYHYDNQKDKKVKTFNSKNGNLELEIKTQKSDSKNNKANTMSCAGSIVFLVWFVISFIAMIVLSNISLAWTFVVLGQYILGFSIVAILKSKKTSLMVLIPIILGLFMLIGGIISAFNLQ